VTAQVTADIDMSNDGQLSAAQLAFALDDPLLLSLCEEALQVGSVWLCDACGANLLICSSLAVLLLCRRVYKRHTLNGQAYKRRLLLVSPGDAGGCAQRPLSAFLCTVGRMCARDSPPRCAALQ
jgi:hypothetical protein